MKLVWLIAPVVHEYISGGDPEESLLTCPLASARLRMGVAAVEWKRSGDQNVFHDPEDAAAFDWTGTAICVVPKFYSDSLLEPWLSAWQAAVRAGCRMVLDISDYPFVGKSPAVVSFYTEALTTCDTVVVNSSRMAELMAPHARHSPVLIDDAILGAPRKPAFAPGKRLELLWFGHPTNLRYLRSCFDALLAFSNEKALRLTIVTELGPTAEKFAVDVHALVTPQLQVRYIAWSLESMRIALRQCDLVLLPSDPADQRKAGASANRIAEALNAGRFPIASPLLSYLPYAEFVWLGDDLLDGVRWALSHRGEVAARIARGQKRVGEVLAMQKIAAAWRALFDRLATPARVGSASATENQA
jgi:hypothetical protein